ncbi:ADAMTS-like protein 1 isoform X2 [Ceratitis capitata]|uniref:ADAMTS-like protein 1 isoform X2 n=1 Tax=Ceratitis capitata TaxID=7213 RepID=UPI0006189459|nr:ADAMTS-like protein 1 isoform X2 [Ceratitis capitata]
MQIRIMDTKIHFWVILLMTIFIGNASVAKRLNASQAFDDTWNTASDLENELECMLQQKRAKSSSSSGISSSATSSSSTGSKDGQWSGWSEWSTCSRTCDGGIMQQIRRCYNKNGCKGESVRYRICNMQPCPEQQDFRAHQCAAYNDVPYDGTLYTWTPHYDYVEPCALTCRGRPAHLHLGDSSSSEAEGVEDPEHYDDHVIVQLSARVQDGTRCRTGSLDMCIQGKCQRVGCDLKIGSTKKIDSCGVCGGDSSSCSQPLYYWETAPTTQCSVTCGGGYKMSQPICRNRVTGVEVADSMCSGPQRPEPSVLLCNTHICPPRWITDDWSPCSRLCGPGYRERMVVCAEENNGIKTTVLDVMCRTPKPATQEPCMIEKCPKWEIEEWAECSATCGQGLQMRGVECKSADGRHSAKCDPLTKPTSVQQCSAGVSCDGGGKIILGSSGPSSDDGDLDEDEEEDDDDSADVEDVDDDGDESDDARHSDAGLTSYHDESSPQYAHRSVSQLHQDEPQQPRAERLTSGGGYGYRENSDPDTHVPPGDPSFVKDVEWSACSVTCGEGVRRRMFRCKVFLEYSRTIATVNDSLCEGIKPHDEVERCVEEPCMLPSHTYDDQYLRDSIKVGVSEPGKTYVWREQGYTSCSASCLGGVEELIINCVREDNGRVVSPFLCTPETKPEARVRTCNDRPCPPRWNYSDYTPCSKSCGIGIKTREVQCIHEVTRGGENTMVVPNSMCPQPPPADRQYCNVLDCPVRWEVGEWSKCSHTCGYGIKERKVECKQIMAQEHKIERPESMCPSAKPPDKKPCNVKPCPLEDPKPVIQVSNTTHIQHDPKKTKITLKVGGAGVVFFGTQVKIKCPVKRYNRTKIKWSKDHKALARSRKFKVSKKGALRILDITFRDAGVYSCHAGHSSAEITIDVKAKPGQQPEELKLQESERLVREGTEALTSADMITAAENSSSSQNNRRKQQGARDSNRRSKSEQALNADGSIMENEQSQLVQQVGENGGVNAGGATKSASASNGGSRVNILLAMPYFQALLSNLQKFGNSRGHHMLYDKGLQFGIDLENFEQDEPVRPQIDSTDLLAQTASAAAAADGFTSSSLTAVEDNNSDGGGGSSNEWHDHQQATDHISVIPNIATATTTTLQTTVGNAFGATHDEDSPHSPHARWQKQGDAEVVITPATPSNHVTYEWRISDWSECSEKCGMAGGAGLRRRTVTCVRQRHHTPTHNALESHVEADMEMVDNAYCEDYGLSIPDTFEVCGQEECARWETGEWTLCQRARCFGRNTAIQKREVKCRYANGTEAANACSVSQRPISRQECYSERCKGVWRVEPWSECNAQCGRQGIKYRILQCVWYGTRRPAGNACRHQPRPTVMKVCKSPPCFTKILGQCKDTSRYCRNVRSMGLCRLHRYQEKCCKSCKANAYYN